MHFKALARSLTAALLLIPMLISGAPPAAAAEPRCSTTTFEGFSSADDARLQRNAGVGSVPYTPSYVSSKLRMSPSHNDFPNGGYGTAFTKSPVPLRSDASFSTKFQFQFTGQTSGAGQTGADGLMFVLYPTNNTAVGGGGSGMGYEGLTPSIGVEFDNFQGSNDTSPSHVGINQNGSVTSLATANLTPDVDNGDVWSVWVDYDGSSKTLEVRAAPQIVDQPPPSRPATATVTRPSFDVATILSSTSPFFGFASSTGAASANHDVLRWDFTNCFAPNGLPASPTVDAGPDKSGETGRAIALEGVVTPGGRPATSQWSVGAGVPCTFADPADPRTAVTCSAAGTYTVTLTADDGLTNPVSDTAIVTVADAPPPTTTTTSPPPPQPAAPVGYRMAAADGGVFVFGEKSFEGSLGDHTLNSPIVGGAAPTGGQGYWLVAGDGGVFSFGQAGFFGSLAGTALDSPVVALEPTATGFGYWLVTARGKVYPFGDATPLGDLTATKINGEIVSLTATASGRGYWLAASDGGVFAFGDAPFLGSMGGTKLNGPVVDMATLPSSPGYYLLGRDGGVFSFGTAAFHGSTGGMRLNQPVRGLAIHDGGQGYWLAADDGGVFAFGSAPFLGSMGGTALRAPVRSIF